MRHADPDALRRLLLTRDDLLREGFTARGIDRALAAGELRRIRQGRYIAESEWVQLWPESRHLAHVVAVDLGAEVHPVFGFTSAAAVHGLPLFRVRVDRVHTVHPEASRRSTEGVVRHRGCLDEHDIVQVGGLLCTSLARTVYDLARLASAEVALVCADTVAGRIGGDPRTYDAQAAGEWIGALTERIERAPSARGIRHARPLVDVIDGRSQQPLEITTKLQLRRLGFCQPGIQIEVPAPVGSYWMDLELAEADAFYECDGETKYTDEALRSGRTIEQVLLAEKRREDWVRGTTNRRVLRGGSAESATPAALAARLQSFGVVLPDRRLRPVLPRRPLLYGQ